MALFGRKTLITSGVKREGFRSLVIVVVTAHFYKHSSLRKQPTFRDATTGFPAKRRLRNDSRIFITAWWRVTMLLIGRCKFSANQKHNPDLGRDVSLTSFPEETMSAVFSGYKHSKGKQTKTLLMQLLPTKGTKIVLTAGFSSAFCTKVYRCWLVLVFGRSRTRACVTRWWSQYGFHGERITSYLWFWLQ